MTELLKALLRMALWLAIFLLCLYALAPAGEAAYNPAPERIIKAAQQTKAPPRGTVARRAWIICRYFTRSTCRGAVNVAWCESTYRGVYLNPRAKNGQYLGVFQMGATERATYGHGRTVWHQAKAARAYWRKSNWRPWACRPN